MDRMRRELGGGSILAKKLAELGITDDTVLDAFTRVPRAEFLTESFRSRCRDNDALPIGYGQTTSQPWVIARMLELARDGRNLSRVLEIGTGCGYQTALLSLLAEEVFSLERIGDLLASARNRLHDLSYTKPRLAHRNGFKGLPEAAPFDAIIVCAATHKVPENLIAQLAPEGRLVLPENRDDHETLTVYTKDESFAHEEVMFVPMLEGVA